MSVTDFFSEAHRLLATWTPATHPLKFAPFVNAYRAIGFMLTTICISHACATWMKGGRPQPRHVPLIITWAVVISCLLVLVLDCSSAAVRVSRACAPVARLSHVASLSGSA